MPGRYEVSEGGDGLLRIGSGARTLLKLSRDDAAALCDELGERLGRPPVKLARVAWWRRALEWFSRKARVRRQLELDAFYSRLGERLADRPGVKRT